MDGLVYPMNDVCSLMAKPLFSMQEIELIDPLKVPSHIAIIMDGNRSWAKARGLSPLIGHWEGAEVLMEIVRAASDLGVKVLTVYSFSTENWSRAPEEVASLMKIFEVYLRQKRDLMVKEGIRIHMIGDLSRFPESVQQAFQEAKEATEHNDKIKLVLALNYGARDEIRRAVQKIIALYEQGLIRSDEVTEELISHNLDTGMWEDPDLVIRTSGQLRVSNFLLWQISYAELYITEKQWPDFSPKDLLEAILAYQVRIRRLGGA